MKTDQPFRITMLVVITVALASSGCKRTDTEEVDPDGAQQPPDGGPDAEPQPPIPELALWESHMTQWGATHCPKFTNSALSFDEKLGATYYDAVAVYHQIAFYTGDATWHDCADAAETIYRDQYVLPNNGSVPGYWNFSFGQRIDWEFEADATSKQAAILLSERASFCADVTPIDWTSSAGRSRETAYCIMSYLNAEALGEPVRARRDAQVAQALGHIDQWFVSKSYRAPNPFTDVPMCAGKYYVQSFMVGLTMHILTRYADATGDAAVLPTVKIAADWLWANAWVAADEAFWYENCADDPDALPAKPGAPDLNLLIAPSFGWLYRKTGDVAYRERGDAIFAGGVKHAYLAGSKQFNQNYMWSFGYVAGRQ